jgi:3-oxoacyl-[acyl-carrier-protein] synthase-3
MERVHPAPGGVRTDSELLVRLQTQSIIVGTGSHLPARAIRNADFLDHEFYDPEGKRIDRPTAEIIRKFEEITGIAERRWVPDDLVTSDIAILAARDALDSSGIDPESLDYVIVAHNFGDVRPDNRRCEFVPSLAARVKAGLKISRPQTIAYDIPFGCPGWLQGVIQADAFLALGHGSRALVIGAETLSRVSDPHDRDSMIYADGAGAVILERVDTDDPVGILCHAVRSDTLTEAQLLRMGRSNKPDYGDDTLFLKMHGHKLYEYALRTVPPVIKNVLERASVALSDVKKVLLHQANAKMDDAIVRRLCKLSGVKAVAPDVVPMTISWLGNSSVATLPTLFDLLLKGRLPGQELTAGDLVVFAAVGAGMNVNSVMYRMP